MIGKEFFKTRKDGVNLYRTVDAKVDENGEFILDNNGRLVPTGLLIMKLETGSVYDEAIDVEGANFTYIQTNIPISEDDNGNTN